MLVRSKTRDIAIIRTMGATRSAVLRIFMTVGLTSDCRHPLGPHLGALLAALPPGAVNAVHLLTGTKPVGPVICILTELPAKTDPVEVSAILIVTSCS